ncbi:MAG: POTRA domain-containing protein [Bacteroidales bacterium]
MAAAKYIVLFIWILFFSAPAIGQETDTIPHNKLFINDIIIEGNKITRDNILLRELVFSRGDTIKKMELIPAITRSRDNLLNLFLFNFVNMEVEHYPGNRANVIVEVQERWYIWPNPIFEHGERNLSTFLKEPEWSKLNYGMWLKWNNFRGRNELLNARIRLGYREQYMLQYEKPNLGLNEDHKLFLSYSLSRQRRVNYATENNRPVYFRDDDNYALSTTGAFVAYAYRPQLYSVHRIRTHYVDDWISDTVAKLNPDFFGEGHTRYRYFKIDYVFRYDIRDSKIYPLEGVAYKLKFEKYGLGILQAYPYGNLEAEAALFYHKRLSNRLYLANVSKGKISSNKDLPLIHQQRAFGYSVNLTGYDDFVIDGTDYVINKLILKYQLVKPQTFSIPFTNLAQFTKVHYAIYINLLGDLGYVNSLNFSGLSNNFMVNELQYSTGIGIDIVTYYDKVLGIEYAINRYGMTGFFFHVTTPFFDW